MEYTLNNEFLTDNPKICLVGCGGTGGFAAESLCRLLTGYRAELILVDHDVVEPHNLLRQNFGQEDVGKFKSEALAERLAVKYGRTVGYSVHPFALQGNGRHTGMEHWKQGLLIGCVDNAPARREMQGWLNGPIAHPRQWLIDAGNGKDWGQILIGNTAKAEETQLGFEGGICSLLPAPSLQRPDILTAPPSVSPDVDCAAAMDLEDQDPTINQTMASLVVSTVYRLMKGKCTVMSLYLDMAQGTVSPNYATPENAARFMPKPAPPGDAQDTRPEEKTA